MAKVNEAMAGKLLAQTSEGLPVVANGLPKFWLGWVNPGITAIGSVLSDEGQTAGGEALAVAEGIIEAAERSPKVMAKVNATLAGILGHLF